MSTPTQLIGALKCYSKRKSWGSFKVDPELWSRFKTDCAMRGVSVCYVLETLMEGWLQAQKVNATIIQPVNMTINMQHVVQRPRRVTYVPEDQASLAMPCGRALFPGRVRDRFAWCDKQKRWLTGPDCVDCEYLPGPRAGQLAEP